jgi:hypothetical protein
MGLNTQSANSLLGPEWATRLDNTVIDSSNRVAARKGWSDVTTGALTDPIISGVEFHKHSGLVSLIVATDNATIHLSTDDGASFSDITGTATFTDGLWQWMNFADSMIGVQDGKQPIVYNTASGQFDHISDTSSEPTGKCGLSAFGRLWIADADGNTLKYCALLDHTDWSGSDTGAFDFKNVWNGTDTIEHVAAFNGVLVVFGKNNILFLSDGAGSALGMDPTQMYVVDTITGTGCVARDSVQHIEGDLWFLSRQGLMSLGRLVQQKSNPMENLSINVQDFLSDSFNDTVFDQSRLRSIYSPRNRFYLLSLPKESAAGQGDELGSVIVFDTRARMEDGSARCLGTWNGLVPTMLLNRVNDDVISANIANDGELFKYTGQNDDGASIAFEYRSGWTDLGGQGFLKMFKRMNIVFFSDGALTVNFKWAWDFNDEYTTRSKTFVAGGIAAEYGIAEWNVGEYSGGVGINDGKVQGNGNGEYIKFGISVTILGEQFSLQQLDLYARIGRYA